MFSSDISTIDPVFSPVSLHSAVYIELGLKQNISDPDSLTYTHWSLSKVFASVHILRREDAYLQESGKVSTEASE